MPPPAQHQAGHNWRALWATSAYLLITLRQQANAVRFNEKRVLHFIEQIGSGLSGDALLLVDTSERVQAVVQESRLESFTWPKHVDICGIALTPGFAERLGPSFPEDSHTTTSVLALADLFPTVSVDPHVSVQELLHALVERLLQPQEGGSSHWHPVPAAVEDWQRSVDADGGYWIIHDLNALSSTKSDVDNLIGIRKKLRETVVMVDSDQWAAWRGVSTNPSAALAKYREQSRLFAVREGRNLLYPRFQFDTNAAPVEGIREVLSVVPTDALGWPLLSWFEAPSALLGGRKPSEVLAKDAKAVADAAKDFYWHD